MTTTEILQRAKEAKRFLTAADTTQKNEVLSQMAKALLANASYILAENQKDMENARGNVSEVMLDRLCLTLGRIEGMAKGITDVEALPDPVGRILNTVERPNGLNIQKISVPMGVIAIIYESRPNVTSDAAALAVKAGSCCVLRCGKEAHRSAAAIVSAMQQGLDKAGLPATAVQLIEDTSRQSATELMTARGLVDLLIPRGGAGLIRACVDNATVPVLETGTGICHIYVDKDADLGKALNILENAKCSRPSVCNAAEVCLVHRDVAETFLPMVYERLVTKRQAAGLQAVSLRLDSFCASLIDGSPAGEKDFDTEFLDYILAIRIVNSAEEAIDHISVHSTGHSEAIVTENRETADFFVKSVDSAAVYINASTRFTDGGEFGLGCEIGISTQKLHARGPMGLEELTTYHYVIHGNGQTR